MANDKVALRGFDMAVPDVGDQLHFRQPLLSFGGNSTLYVARRVDWHGDGQALAVVDECEAVEMATLFTDGIVRHVTSGEGVAVAGAEFFQAASRVGLQMDGFNRLSALDCECWISVATPADFVALKRDLVDESRTVFDEELGKARRQRSRLTDRGNAAMLILRRCGPLRREDLAIRQLAAARQNRDLDLYRRLLARFELELDEPEDRLHKQVERHIDLADALEGSPLLSLNMESKVFLYPPHQPSRASWESRRDLEGTLRIGASVIESVADFMRNMDMLSADAKRRIGEDLEENLKRAGKRVEEIEQMLNLVDDP